MVKKRLKEIIEGGKKFAIITEFVPLAGHRLSNFESFLTDYQQKRQKIPQDFELTGISIPQSPSGVASMSPVDIFNILGKKGLWSDLDVIAHITAKDHNLDAISSYLTGLQKAQIQSVLALTGDKPVKSKGVFEVDSIGLIEFIQEINEKSFNSAKISKQNDVKVIDFGKVHQFFVAGAVSQFKYTEASQMQQYYKMVKKIRSGAQCLITQMGWDWLKCAELMRYMQQEGITAPVLGNVYLLTTKTPAPRLMHEGKLMGCVVTDELFARLHSETLDDHIKRAAVQVAMYRDMGAAGVDIGGIFDFDMLVDIVQQADEIGSNWRSYKEMLEFGVPGGWYLYKDDGSRVESSRPRKTLSKRNFNMFHKMLFEQGKGIRKPVQKFLGLSRSMRTGSGAAAHCFHSLFEKPVKSLLFHCEDCGDCFLYENFGLCTLGRCAKGLHNPPCGDALPDGRCGNNPDIRCVGELVYESAASEGMQGLQRLREQINPPRKPQLAFTSSILNNMFGRDHCRKVGLVQIGSNIHSMVPKVGLAIEMGDEGSRAFINSLISSQLRHHADYIGVNIDSFTRQDRERGREILEQLMQMAGKQIEGKNAGQAGIFLDSADSVLIADGLKWWTGKALGPILVRVCSLQGLNEYIPYLNNGGVNIIYRLEQSDTAEAYHKQVRELKQKIDSLTGNTAKGSCEIFAELPVVPLMDDVADEVGKAGKTYSVFQAISKIKRDANLTGVKTAIDVVNCARKLPGRSIGVMRAYIAVAQKYGLNAILADVTRDFGYVEPADDLIKLIEAFVRQDGSEQAYKHIQDKMGAFCMANKKR